MKTANITAILTALLTAGALASPADTNTPAPTAIVDTNTIAEPIPTNGLVLNFHGVPLGTVLNYLSAKAGLIIVSDANLQGTVTVVARQPITTNEVVDLLNDQLNKNNLTAVLQGRTLNIMDSERAKSLSTTPVKVATSPSQVPLNDEIVTEILPVQTLNPEQLVKDLESLIPKDATVSANEAGSAIIMTAPQRDVHRISEIISDLDSSSVSDVEVFILKYADAKSVASELKEVFESADSDVARANTRNNFASRFGRGGGGFGAMFGGGGGGGGGSSSEDTKNAQTHAIFSSDDQMNAVIASAPPGYMPYITNVITSLDQPSQDITEIKVFKLKHADPVEIADELGTLFPNSNTSSDQNNRSMGFRFTPPWMQQRQPENNQSDRMKLQTSVVAVADRRTESVIVTASKDLMGEIKGMIDSLDEGDGGDTRVTAFRLNNADPAAVELTITGLFLNQGSPSSSTTSSALSAREQGNVNSQSTSTTSSTSGFGGSTGTSALH
ncbi:MAG TPA: secretin N-terminal domain-containing protein [Verrucomicrobiae bacterium]|jgi:type II secretory pathway component GspD/PulD (secretin)|nr:secretin N-terminal domain-containing protein [Verrucomicrobiae bacterium]